MHQARLGRVRVRVRVRVGVRVRVRAGARVRDRVRVGARVRVRVRVRVGVGVGVGVGFGVRVMLRQPERRVRHGGRHVKEERPPPQRDPSKPAGSLRLLHYRYINVTLPLHYRYTTVTAGSLRLLVPSLYLPCLRLGSAQVTSLDG